MRKTGRRRRRGRGEGKQSQIHQVLMLADTRMIPAGYLLKRTVPPPGWLTPNLSGIREVCSVSGCVNEDLIDPSVGWRCNSFGFVNNPVTLIDMARDAAAGLSDAEMFFYSIYEQELETDGWTFEPSQWRPISVVTSTDTDHGVVLPDQASILQFLGFDVVAYGSSGLPDHSPLSCNSVATREMVNKFCLFDRLEDAKKAIDTGVFGGGCEDGIYRIVSVSRVRIPAMVA